MEPLVLAGVGLGATSAMANFSSKMSDAEATKQQIDAEKLQERHVWRQGY
jgi:hypothetical protein